MKKYVLSFFLICIGFFIGHKYTLDKKAEFNSEIITTCFMNISKASSLKDFLHINVINDNEIVKIQYNNNSNCLDFENFNVTLIKFNKNTTDTLKLKISETIKPHEEIEISLHDFECDSMNVLTYEIISVNLSEYLR